MEAASQKPGAVSPSPLARVDDESSPRNRSTLYADNIVPDSPEHTWAAPTKFSSRSGKSLRLKKLQRAGADSGNLNAQPRPESAPSKSICTNTPTACGDHSIREFTSDLCEIVGAGHGQGACGDDSAGFPGAGRQAEFRTSPRNSKFLGRKDQSAEPSFIEGNGTSIACSSSPERSFSSQYDALRMAQARSQDLDSGVPGQPYQTCGRKDGVVPLSFFVTGRLETISVSSATLAKTKVKLGDENFMEAGPKGNPGGSSGVCVADGRQAPAVGYARISASSAIGSDHADGSDAAPLGCFATETLNPIAVSSAVLPKAELTFGDDEFIEIEPNGNPAGPREGCSADGSPSPAYKEARVSSGNAVGLDDADGSDVMPLKPISLSSGAFAKSKGEAILGDGDLLEIGVKEKSAGHSKRLPAGSPQASDSPKASALKRARTSPGNRVGLDHNDEVCEEIGCFNMKPIWASSTALTKGQATSNEASLSGLEGPGNPGGPSEGSQTHGQEISAIQRAEGPSGIARRLNQTSGREIEPKALFMTGKWNRISISNAAMAKAKAMFSDDDVPSFESNCNPVGPLEGCSPHGGEALGFEKLRTPPVNAVGLDHPRGSLELEDALRTFEARSGMMYSVSNEAISTAKAMLASARSSSNQDVQGQKCIVEGRLNVKRTTAPFKPPRSHKTFVTSGDTTEKARSMRAAPFKPPRSQETLATSGDASEKAKRTRADGDNRASSDTFLQRDCGKEPPTRSEIPPIRGRERTNLHAVIPGVTADDAEVYRIFVAKDGMRYSVSALETWRSLLDLGVDGSYATKEWVANHYKWIVWKWGSSHFRNPGRAQSLLTPESVLQGLKSRYEMESSGHQPIVMKVAEGTITAAVTMILCVSAIRHHGSEVDVDRRSGLSMVATSTLDHFKEGLDKAQQQDSEPAMIELTDGWYRLNAVLDTPLAKLLQQGKLKVGQNLQICGASLRSRPDGSSPLEAFHGNALKIHMNGTYRARYDKRLGLCKDPFIPLSFDYIEPDGGVVTQTLFGVTRVYPFLFKEVLGKGLSIIRSVRAEELEINNFANRRTKVIDEAVSRAEDASKLALTPEETDEDEKLFDLVENASEPDILMADMTPEQLRAFPAYQARKEDRKRQIIDNAVKDALREAGLESRNVRRLLKVRVVGLKGRRGGDLLEDQLIKEGTVTLWDINDEQPPIDEGSVYRVSGLQPATWTATRCVNHIQLNSYASTRWGAIGEAAYKRDFLFAHTPRKAMRLCEMDDIFVKREFDIAAVVVEVGEPFPAGVQMNQWIFVADGTVAKTKPGDTWDETQILAIRLSLRSDAFVPIETSTLGSVVGFGNLLQHTKDRFNHVWVAEATELTFFSSNLNDPHLKHLQIAGACAQEWANSNRMVVVDLRDHVQTCILSGPLWLKGG